MGAGIDLEESGSAQNDMFLDVDVDEGATAADAVADDLDIEEDFEHKPPRGIVIALVLIILVAVGLVAGIALSGDDEPVVDNEPQPQETTTPAVDKEPEIVVSARVDGAPIEGATVLVGGVEKGVTPLTLRAEEIRNSSVVVRYRPPDGDETVEQSQQVTDPRDVMVEFDDVVSELTTIELEDVVVEETPVEDAKKPKETKPRPRPRPRPRPKPKPKLDPVYVAPE